MGWIRQLFSRRRRYDELAETIREHLNEKIADLMDRGMTQEQAESTAHREFGNVTRIEERSREVWQWPTLESIWSDIKFALRQLRRSPGFTIVALSTLALGIGVTAAIFSVMNAVLLRPLAFSNSEQLVQLWDSYDNKNNAAPVSYPNFLDWRDWNHSFSGIAAFTESSYVLTGAGDPVHLEGVAASANLFQILGVQPILGRRFLPEEDHPNANSGADSIILSYKTWQEYFQGKPDAAGKKITLDGKPFVIIGVAPQGIESQLGEPGPQFWTTTAPLAEVSPQSPKPLSQERQISFLSVIGRLKTGVTIAQAQADMDHVASELMKAYPVDDPKEGVIIQGLQDSMTGDIRPRLFTLLAAVGVVLIIACANVAVLMLVRSTGRQREIAIRTALGAGHKRIARQMFIENLLLAVLGAAGGLGVAVLTGHTLLRVLGVTWLTHVPFDNRVLGFALLMAVGSAMLFGFAPMLQAFKTTAAQCLKESGGRATSESRTLTRVRKMLVAVQVAFAVVLLSLAGLITRSLINLEHTDPGFNATHVISFPVGLDSETLPQTNWPAFYEELLAQLRNLPGIEAASASGALPFDGPTSRTVLDNVAGRPIPDNERRGIEYIPVTPNYFQTLRIPIRVGRDFTGQDTASSEPVVIINEAAARRYFGKENPLGRQIEPMMWDGAGSKTKMRTIIGIVGDVRNHSLDQSADPVVYWPVTQIPSNSTMFVAVRTTTSPAGMIGEVRHRLQAMDKNLPLYNLQSLDHYVDQTLTQPRYNTLLMISFALLALILTMVGLYGSISYSVARRTHEIGIRMTLGAQRKDILRAVIRDGMIVGSIGLAIGIPVAVAATRLIRSLLYGVSSSDPATFTAAALILLTVSFLASCIPAFRAAKVDPMKAIRTE